ncbi:MAG: hypothetical protein HQM00_05340 [Magnetococcales bacterium]|nr:hypothetical protein [Magnetococcales bacterium]
MKHMNHTLIAALTLAGLVGLHSDAVAGSDFGNSSRENAPAARESAPDPALRETPATPSAINRATDPKATRWGMDREQVKRRWDTVNTLVELSSGAKKVTSSGRPEAVALRDQARSLRDEAKGLLDKGELKGASDKLGQATQKMFAAVKEADGGESKRGKQEQDFNRRLESVRVLTDALDRIGKEKSSAQAAESGKQVKSLIGQAQSLMAKGDQEGGRTALDKAYVTAKTSIELLRRGDTLVRTLKFASKEEEYHYEVDRNDTHQMLIGMLLKDTGKAADPRIKEFVAKAAELRRQADQMGQSARFEEAIQVLEQSTMELVRAIRSAGIFIPG